jgi:DNA-binding NarL/FixJ family response regulator
MGAFDGGEAYMSAIKILLAEDHCIVREGTRRLLERLQDVEVIGEAADGGEAVRLVDALDPNLVLMDVCLPGLNGIEATRLIKTHHPDTRVLILSAYADDHYVFPLLEAGADGYLLKTATSAELEKALRAVCAGEMALDPHLVGRVVARLNRRSTAHAEARQEGLTEREIQVLQLAAHGKANKQIGEALSLSPYTVQAHLRNIFAKLNVTDRTEAVAFAVAQGWISLR